MPKSTKCNLSACTALAALLTIGGPAAAQLAPSDRLNAEQTDSEAESNIVVVTAQRRAESVQDVPISVTAITARELKANGIEDIQDAVQFIPGLSGKTQGLLTPIFAVRGVATQSFGAGGENSIGTFWDGAYAGRVNSQNLAFFDLNRIEVLKGPQGALFGRNASTGAISIITNGPNKGAGGIVRLSGASYDVFEGEVAGDMVSKDGFGLRLAGFARSSGGWDKNVLTGKSAPSGDTYSIRAKSGFEFSDQFSGELVATWQKDDVIGLAQDNLDPGLNALSGLPADPFDGRFAGDPDYIEQREMWLSNLTLTYEFADNLRLESVTNYSDTRTDISSDVDATVPKLFEANYLDYKATAFGQDIRIVGVTGIIDWFVGANVYVEDIGQTVRVKFDEGAILGGLPIDGSGALFCEEPVQSEIFGSKCDIGQESITSKGDYFSWSVYADAVFKPTDRLSLTVGLRYSEDKKDFVYETVQESGLPTLIGPIILIGSQPGGNRLSQTYSDLQPRLVVDYKLSKDVLIYASAARGFKAGGFDPTSNLDLTAFDPEKNWSYEAGIKTSGFDGRLILNAAAFYSDYQDFQIQTVSGGVTSTANAPVESKGFEIEANFDVTSAFRIAASADYVDATFGRLVTDDGDFTGNKLTFAPKFSGSVLADWSLARIAEGDVSARLSYTYESKQFLSEVNAAAESQDAYGLTNLRLIYLTDSDLQVSLFAKNLFDVDYLVLADDFGFGVVTARGQPKMFGIEVSQRF
jgi:iron complex outermembrane receptor protein